MHVLRILLACLLVAVAPLRAHADMACCPPGGDAAHVHDAATHADGHAAHGAGHLPAGNDDGPTTPPCGLNACAQHCAATGLPVTHAVPTPVLRTVYADAPPPRHPPLVHASPHERPPKPAAV